MILISSCSAIQNICRQINVFWTNTPCFIALFFSAWRFSCNVFFHCSLFRVQLDNNIQRLFIWYKSDQNSKKSVRPPFLDFFTSFLHFFQISNCWTGNVSWLRPTRVFVSYHWQPESGIQNLQSVLSLFLAIFWVHTFCQYLFVSFEYISLANFKIQSGTFPSKSTLSGVNWESW